MKKKEPTIEVKGYHSEAKGYHSESETVRAKHEGTWLRTLMHSIFSDHILIFRPQTYTR